MKTKNIALMTLALCLAPALQAASPVLTSLSHAHGHVLAGVKSQLEGHEPQTYLLKVSADKLTSQKIALPTGIQHREVIFLQPAQRGKVVVVTQRKIEQGDKPLVHRLDLASGKWEKLKEVDCSSVASIGVSKGSLDFKCLETTASGDEVEKVEKVAISDVDLKHVIADNFPQTKSRGEKVSAELSGERFEWHELKIIKAGKSHVVKP